jgi:hypothetical protein
LAIVVAIAVSLLAYRKIVGSPDADPARETVERNAAAIKQ